MEVGHISNLTTSAEVGGNVTFTCYRKYCTEDCQNDKEKWYIHSPGDIKRLILVDSTKIYELSKKHLHFNKTSEWSSEYNRTEFSLTFTNLSMEENNTLVSCQVETIECGVVNPIQPFLLIVTEPTPDGNSTDTTLTSNTTTSTSNIPTHIDTATQSIAENCTNEPITIPIFILIPIAVVELVVIVLLAFCLFWRCTIENSYQTKSDDSCQAIKVICSDRPYKATETEMESGNLRQSYEL